MLNLIKKLVPASWLSTYHFALSWFAAAWYGNPSEKLIVVGVTGTNGKTTTTYLTAKALEALGDQTGCTSTALFKIGAREWLNDTKMTMLGRFRLQQLLNDMVKAGCRYAVVETSSQGITQHRHRHINYDVAVFTNLHPEHVEAHGGFDNYKRAKIGLFAHIARSKRKKLPIGGPSTGSGDIRFGGPSTGSGDIRFGGPSTGSGDILIPKIAVLNRASEHAKDFAVPGFDRTVWYGIGKGEGVSAIDVKDEGWGSSFTVEGLRVMLNLPSEVNVENATAAITAAIALGLPLDRVAKRLGTVTNVPGRFERIVEGQPFTVVVDYAPEPGALKNLYALIDRIPHGRLIHVLGSAGGGRDVSRRPILGKMAAGKADVVIVTNEDPYDDDPSEIIRQVADGARAAGAKDVREIMDRREAIASAMREARPDDLVLLTGKGCEQAIMVANGGRIPWDERKAAREAIRALSAR